MKRARDRWFNLTTKAVVALLVIAIAPLVMAVIMVKGVAVAAQNVAVGEAERLHGAIEHAIGTFREVVEARKRTFREVTQAMSSRTSMHDACSGAADPDTALRGALDRHPDLGELTLTLPDGSRYEVTQPGPRLGPEVRKLTAEHGVAGVPGCTLGVTYVIEEGKLLLDELQHLGDVMRDHKKLEHYRNELPPSYNTAFVLVVGGFVLFTTALAIVFARYTTQRIGRLVEGTVRVAEGDLSTRVALPGSDELTDLSLAFDHMVSELARSRAEIEYLEKIGAWQEVARRLAHEIKNPLTPIQLAVQQLKSKYAGDDPRFQKVLDDAHTIVTEEIGALRRLVDAFSGFAKLPRVEARPLDLALVVDDVERELPDGVALVVDGPPRAVSVAADRLLLRRVLVNLVENAAQAGAKQVRIGWRQAGDSVRLVVDDDGPGVPGEVAAKVFDPYITTKPHGTGLGLAIVKKTILEHGGTISLAAGRSDLGGARFEVMLPGLS